MNTAVTFLILTVAFTVIALLVRVANQTGSRRLRLDQFRMAAPMSGRLFGDNDPDAYRIRHDADAIRTRFEQHPHWPSSRVLGERR